MSGIHEGYSGQGKGIGSQETRARFGDRETAPRHSRSGEQKPPTHIPDLEIKIVVAGERFSTQEAYWVGRSGTSFPKTAVGIKKERE